MSAVIKEMAFTVLRRTEVPPSSEAAHAALLFAHIVWNRRSDMRPPDYRPMLRESESSNPNLWNELSRPIPTR